MLSLFGFEAGLALSCAVSGLRAALIEPRNADLSTPSGAVLIGVLCLGGDVGVSWRVCELSVGARMLWTFSGVVTVPARNVVRLLVQDGAGGAESLGGLGASPR